MFPLKLQCSKFQENLLYWLFQHIPSKKQAHSVWGSDDEVRMILSTVNV